MTKPPYNVILTELTDVAIPSSKAGRPALPNPFLAAVKVANGTRGTAKSVAIPFGTDEKRDELVKSIPRDLTKAGQAIGGILVRRNVSVDEMGKFVTVLFWVVDKSEPKPEAEPVKDNEES